MLTGCSSPQIITEYQTIKLTPPSILLVDCLCPQLPEEPASNLDILAYTIDLRLALESCNQDKVKLREFYEPDSSSR
jgi:hypothetical protein